MSSDIQPASEPNAATPRRTGRRPKGDGTAGPQISRELIVEVAVKLAREESLAALSMVRLAKEVGVAPALIHYYMKSRDDLLSAVLNVAFRERVEAMPPLTGDWRKDLAGVARSMIATMAAWPGMAAYINSNNRFRLFQRVRSGEVDYGLAFFDHVGRIFKAGGFTGRQAALGYHLLMLFIMSIAAERENHQTPSDHESFIVGYVSKFDKAEVPGAAHLVKPFARLKSSETLDAGLALVLDGFEGWLTRA